MTANSIGPVRCEADCKNTLGEGCFWHPAEHCLYWTDIEEKKIFRLAKTGTWECFTLPERAGFILPRRAGGFILGFPKKIVRADEGLKNFEKIAPIEESLPQTRINDAKTDPGGGIVFGTFDEQDRKPIAALYRISPQGKVQKLLEGVAISNGIAFSPCGQILYFSDTAVGTVRRFSISSDFGEFREREPLAGLDIAPGKPDGAAVDEEGFYWSARVWGSALARISPEGEADKLIELPIQAPTCLAFGGDNLNTLYLTSLSKRHSQSDWQRFPQSGGLFSISVPYRGLPNLLCDL